MNKFWTKGKKPTHVLMDGGTLHVTPDRLNEFNQDYCQSIRNGIKLFVVEQKTFPCYKFFIDVDYVDEEALTFENIQSLIHVMCDKISTLIPDDKCIVSVAKPKPKGSLTKTGIHLNWPNCVVDQEQALNIRDHLIFHLSKIYSVKDWNKIIDCAVFGDPKTGSNGSGFRLPWSHKKTKEIIEGPYIPFFAYQKGKITDITGVSITPEMVQEVSVRTQEEVPNVKVTPVQIFSLEKPSPKQRGKEIDNSEAVVHLETFIRKYLEGQSHMRVHKLMKDRTTYAVQTNSRYCENLGREHSSNHVWFLVKKDGSVCQKCFCTCETTRGRKHHTMCKDFVGKRHVLPNSVMHLLYPEKKEEHLNKLKKLGII